MAVGDFNADGLPDIVLVVGASLDLLFGDGGGGFPSDTSIYGPGSWDFLGGLAVADFNADGLPDLALSVGGAFSPFLNGFLVLYSQSDGGLLASQAYTTSEQEIFRAALAVGDLNNDGLIDVASFDGSPGCGRVPGSSGRRLRSAVFDLTADRQCRLPGARWWGTSTATVSPIWW